MKRTRKKLKRKLGKDIIKRSWKGRYANEKFKTIIFRVTAERRF